jgi:hypothetical protein
VLSIENRIVNRIYGGGKGNVFTPNHFLDLGSRRAVDVALFRLSKQGVIRRLARGLYDFPKSHPVLGVLSPSPDVVAKALTDKSRIRLQPSGAYAANLLHLSDQVPVKIVFLTDGPSKTVRFGGQQIRLKHTTPKNMATAGRMSGLVIQALRYLGKPNVDDTVIQKLRRTLSSADRQQLLKDVAYAPAWIGAHFREIAGAS